MKDIIFILKKLVNKLAGENYYQDRMDIAKLVNDLLDKGLGSVISADVQFKLLQKTLDKVFVEFDDEQDKNDFILDICNEYKNQTNEYVEKIISQT